MPGREPLTSVGRPVPGVDVRIDPGARPGHESDEAGAPAGDAGEILARGTGVFRGYRHREDATHEAFTQDGWFRTGDLGRMDEHGNLYVTGRVSTMIVTEGGENVQPDNVEALYEQHPLIREIGVLGRDGKLVALVAPDADAVRERDAGDADTAAQQAVNERSREMPSYMRLSSVRTTRDALPRTRLGKIRRHKLEERYDLAGSDKTRAARGDPVEHEDMSDRDRSLLENDTERRVWEWLGDRFPNSGLTPDTDLRLDLDVDSMEWLNLTLEIRRRTGAELSEEAVARISTVCDLLQEAADAGARGGSAADPVESPYEVLTDEQQTWLEPLGPAMRAPSLLSCMIPRSTDLATQDAMEDLALQPAESLLNVGNVL